MSLKSLLNSLQHCFCFTFWFWGQEACGLLAPQPRIEHATPALEMQSLNHWTTGEVPLITFKWVKSQAGGQELCYTFGPSFGEKDILQKLLVLRRGFVISKIEMIQGFKRFTFPLSVHVDTDGSDSGKEAEPHGTFLSRVSVMLICARMPEFINMHYTLCLFLFHQGFARFWSVCAW